jgi:hypothetical protein
MMKCTSLIPLLLIIYYISPLPLHGLQSSDKDNILKERDNGLPSSVYGMYVHPSEMLIYPFYEYGYDHNMEYQPSMFHGNSNADYLAKYKSTAEQIYLGYGVSDLLAVEFEAAYLKATFDKSVSDSTSVPSRIKESGLTDYEAKICWRWAKETDHRPDICSFVEVTIPSNQNKLLIGDPDWDVKPGVIITKGYPWGILSFKTDLEFNREAKNIDVGETAVKYLRQLQPDLRLFLDIEGGEGGAPDEWVLVPGLQWYIAPTVSLQIYSPVGIFPKATDWSPQIGIQFSQSIQTNAGNR